MVLQYINISKLFSGTYTFYIILCSELITLVIVSSVIYEYLKLYIFILYTDP